MVAPNIADWISQPRAFFSSSQKKCSYAQKRDYSHICIYIVCACAWDFAQQYAKAKILYSIQVRSRCGCLMDLLCEVCKSNASLFLLSRALQNPVVLLNQKTAAGLESWLMLCSKRNNCVCARARVCSAYMNVQSMHFHMPNAIWINNKLYDAPWCNETSLF